MGAEEAASLANAGCKLVACHDTDPHAAAKMGVSYYFSLEEFFYRNPMDIVIVSTPIDTLAEFTIAALHSGKHVLVEKPAARNVAEVDLMMAAEKESRKHVRVGFNLRYHRVFRKAIDIVPDIGLLYFVRARYGHGGREGYEKDWRMNTRGGEMIDQGVHLIDLASWYLGEFTKVIGVSGSWYWAPRRTTVS